MNMTSLLTEKTDAYAKDIRQNLETVLTETGAPGLSTKQIEMVVLSSAYATHYQPLIDEITKKVAETLSAAEINAAKIASALMAMNNIYYRFTHMVQDEEYAKMPVKLRMSLMATPGVAKVDFEMMALAVSIIHGCDYCINAHVNGLAKISISKEAVQSVARIAAVMHAVALSWQMA